MNGWTWLLRDDAGKDLRRTEAFDAQAAAEAWLAEAWPELRGEGVEEVLLFDGEVECYRMGLGSG